MNKIPIEETKKFLINLRNLFFWLIPLALFLVSTYLPKILWNLTFEDYLEFLKILVWPYTALIILFFFKKVVTYLFFSLDGFNFFGAKGTLRNVYEVINDEVSKKFFEEKKEMDQRNNEEKLNIEIKRKEDEIKKVTEGEKETIDLLNEILEKWKESTREDQKTIDSLQKENKRLRDVLFNLSTSNTPLGVETNLTPGTDDSKTSDPIPDAENEAK